MNQIYKCKIYDHKTFNVKSIYLNRMEALESFPHNTYMLYDMYFY